jgi:hypothetical protein
MYIVWQKKDVVMSETETANNYINYSHVNIECLKQKSKKIKIYD